MDEEETKQEGKNVGKEETAGAKDDRAKPQTTSVIEMAKTERKSMEAENDRREAILDREERLEADKMLGGRAEAGSVPDKQKVLTDAEKAEA